MFLFSFSAAHAQSVNFKAKLDPLDTLGYRMSVISKVRDVAVIAGISPARQLTLAAFFQKEEASLAAMQNIDTTVQAIQSLQNQLAAEFQFILSSQELTAYRAKRKEFVYAKVLSGSN